jgi:hypothetical protein
VPLRAALAQTLASLAAPRHRRRRRLARALFSDGEEELGIFLLLGGAWELME